jgi:hypothetical protein
MKKVTVKDMEKVMATEMAMAAEMESGLVMQREV